MLLQKIITHISIVATVSGFVPHISSHKVTSSVKTVDLHSSDLKLNAFRATWEPFHVPWSSSWENIEFDVETDRKELALLGINDDFIVNDEFIKREIEEQSHTNVAVIIKNENIKKDKDYGP